MSEETPIEQNAIEEQLKKLQNQNTTLYRELNSQKRKIEALTQEQNTHTNSIKSVQSDMLNNASTIDNLTNILNGLKQTSQSHETQLKNLLNHVQTEVKSMQQNIQGVKEIHNAHKEELASKLQNHKEKLEEVQTKAEKTGEAVKVVAENVEGSNTQPEAQPEPQPDADAELTLNDTQKDKLATYNENFQGEPITENDIIEAIKRNGKTVVKTANAPEDTTSPTGYSLSDSGYKIGENGDEGSNNAAVMFTADGWFKDTTNTNVKPYSINKNNYEISFEADRGFFGNLGNFANFISNRGGKKTRRKNKKQKRKSVKKRRKSRK